MDQRSDDGNERGHGVRRVDDGGNADPVFCQEIHRLVRGQNERCARCLTRDFPQTLPRVSLAHAGQGEGPDHERTMRAIMWSTALECAPPSCRGGEGGSNVCRSHQTTAQGTQARCSESRYRTACAERVERRKEKRHLE